MVLYEVTVRPERKAKGHTVNLRPPDKLPVENSGSGEQASRNPAGGITRRPAKRRKTHIKIATFVKKKEILTVRNLAVAILLLIAMVIWLSRGEKGIDQQQTGGIALPEAVKTITPLISVDFAVPKVPKVKIEEIIMPPAPKKGNVIVIASNTIADQLGPVDEFFQEKGIETEIHRTGDRYVLVTAERFSGKSDPKFDALKRQIEQVGKEYNPPQGFKSFGFDSIYLLNVSKMQ